MKKFLSILIIILSFSCKDKNERIVEERKVEIEKIIECVILQDSLNVFKSDSNAIPLSRELKKLIVYSLTSNMEKIPPKPENGIYLKDLFYYYLDEDFLLKKDSLNILNQNQTLKRHLIENSFSRKIKLTTFQEQRVKAKSNVEADFLYLSIPIFSADNRKAYIEITEICFGNCGWGKALYLTKENGKWKILYEKELWIG
jgi:hypothetical protein